MLRIASGHSADYLLNAVAAGRENYYTGAVAQGEPPGRWYGAGAAGLGFSGLVDAQDMKALFEHFVDPADPAFRDPAGWAEAAKLGHAGRRYLSADELYARALDAEPYADAERREVLRVEASKAERRNVAFLDATFSVQKSVTVLHTAFEAQQEAARRAGRVEEAEAWGRCRQAVENGIWAGNRAMLDYLSAHAGYSRVGHHGGAAGRWVDAHDWVVASFFQHDSRDHDPQLHIHNPILNRVRCSDGQWRTVDGRSLYRFRGAAAAVGERVMEEYITHALGVRFAARPDGKAREILGIPQRVMDLFSSRRRAITPRQAELIAAFEAEKGRAPNALERDRLAQQATLATRKAKSHQGESRAQALRRWDAQLRAEITGGLAGVARHALACAGREVELERWSPLAVIETALAAVQDKHSAWTAPDLTREISNALPDRLGITDPAQLGRLLDRLTAEGLTLAVPLDPAKPGDEVLPDAYRLGDGSSAFDAPGLRRYATPAHLHTERLLVAASISRDGPAVSSDAATRYLDELAAGGVKLGADQAAAVCGVLTSGARIESVIGPAGTGKSFVVGALAKAWADPALWAGQTRRVFGLATSQIAADVLTGEGVTAANTARWLGTQDRLANGRGSDTDRQWELRRGDLVVVDESSMADTASLAAVRARVDAAGAKMLLVGDHRQLGAVGAGGAMDLLAEHGCSYELVEARRFTQQWEREASLRLRAGDPSVVDEYHKRGRIVDGGTSEETERAAARRWLGDTLAGKHALLVVDTNEQAARINADLRAELVKLGRVTDRGVRLGAEGTHAGVGDVVQARLNGWNLAGYAGNKRGPINRERYRVLQTRTDGSLVVTPLAPVHSGRGVNPTWESIVLPAGYVAEHVTLGYAATVHAAEGLSVDTGIEVATAATRAEALYPGATRGREANTIFVVTQAPPAEDAATGEVAEAVRHDPRAVLSGILEAAEPELSASATGAEADEDAANVRTPAERLAVAAEHAVAERTARWLDELTDTGQLSIAERTRIAAEDGARKLGAILRRAELAGHNAKTVLTKAVTERLLTGAQQISNVLYSRIADAHTFDPQGDRYTDRTPHVENPQWQRYLDTLAAAADQRQHQLGEQLAASPPSWALEALGTVPDGGPERTDWIARAGTVAAQRELSGHDDPNSAIGPAPAPGQPEAHAAWRAAWRALGRPDADRDELQMSDGQLRMRVRAYEREQTWAPRLVANELAATIQAADHQRSLAARRDAEAQAATDPDQRAALHNQAAEAAALAETLDGQAEQLRELDDVRAHWLAHTAATRAAADRARAELANRHAGDQHTEQQVTADEWMAAHDEAMRAEDLYRAITDEADLTDTHTNVRANGATDAAELPAPVDIRQLAGDEPAPADEHTVRVPTAAETAESIRRAQRALDEITERDALDQAHEQAHEQARAEQLARWHADDQAAEYADAYGDTDDLGDGLGVEVVSGR